MPKYSVNVRVAMSRVLTKKIIDYFNESKTILLSVLSIGSLTSSNECQDLFTKKKALVSEFIHHFERNINAKMRAHCEFFNSKNYISSVAIGSHNVHYQLTPSAITLPVVKLR